MLWRLGRSRARVSSRRPSVAHRTAGVYDRCRCFWRRIVDVDSGIVLQEQVIEGLGVAPRRVCVAKFNHVFKPGTVVANLIDRLADARIDDDRFRLVVLEVILQGVAD